MSVAENKGGRPKKEFDLRQVENLGLVHASYEEMAAALGCSKRTIINYMQQNAGFFTAFKKGQANGKLSIRRLQIRTARGDYNPEDLLVNLKEIIKSGQPPSISELTHLVQSIPTKYKPGNPTMQIWLGKNLLGQRETPEVAGEMDATGPDWIERDKLYALKHVDYHREVLYGSPLYPPEVEAIQLVEKHIAQKSGKVLTIRSARQTMKNECSAMIATRVLERYKDKGGTYIRTAPTWKPQIVNSKTRLERFLMADPLVKDNYRRREGYIFQCGLAHVHFLSTDTSAKVVGDTADICLDIDEAHKVDKGKFEEDFSPMTASTNAPVVLWGVAADKQDLLYEYLQHNLKHNPDCVLQYPASIWCELLPRYAEHYEERVAKLGADHPVILTQYDLVDVDAIGGYFSKHHQTSLLSSDHGQYSGPRPGRVYVVTIDIGGEAEDEETNPLVKAEGSRDSTVALIWEVDYDNRVNGYPMCRLVDIHWWTGKSLGDEPSGLPGQQTILLKLLQAWRPRHAVVDGRGVGEQIANYLNANWGAEAYKASVASVSADCYDLHAMVNNGRVKVFRDDLSTEYQELGRQIKHTSYEIRQHDQMRITKPHGKGHIDMVKAMTYLPRAVLGPTPGHLPKLKPEEEDRPIAAGMMDMRF